MALRMDLSRENLLDVLEQPEFEALRAIFVSRRYGRRRIIFRPGEAENMVFIVASGKVRIFFAHEDKELTLSILKPGDIYTTHTRAFVQAFKDSTILTADAEAFRRALPDHPALAYSMIRVLGDLLRKAYSMIIRLAFLSARRRLEEYLAHEAEQRGMKSPDGVRVHLDLTVEQLASILGSTRQTISSLLGEMASEGLLHKEERGVYNIPDPALLGHR
ncbi:transcriptional regulator, Crp/Fnr family [Desulfovibrio sp. X2]|uniref:Crp/Fnr family transcriptional regulator n=1 Tax=Desulfovibrio sp. X2 TaxID=941449 RepID=UPI000358902F|nr:Crp/Fnr family transcriptional regulator [Desulfovibrio sp. X2]EPR43173.1 transcriptional regulator, Crp/Fnr family [Desulfovibrio sp. X2]